MNAFDEQWIVNLPPGYICHDVAVAGNRRFVYYCKPLEPSLFLIYEISDKRLLLEDDEEGFDEFAWVIDHSPEITVVENPDYST